LLRQAAGVLFRGPACHSECVMDDAAVADALNCLENHETMVWIDGGWGIDVLVGEQTRKHDDLDLVVAQRQLAAAQSSLRELGHGIGHHRHSRITTASLEAAARLRAVRRVAVLKLIVHAIDTWFICRFGDRVSRRARSAARRAA
jgi:hypothetical protein